MDAILRPYMGIRKGFEFPTLGAGLCHHSRMAKKTAKELLAAAVNGAIASGRTSHLTIVGKKIISNGKLGRLRHGAENVGIDTLDALAGHLRVQPWQPIHPEFAPSSPNLSDEAMDLALALDAISDPALKARSHALAMQMLALNPVENRATPTASAPPSPWPSAKRAPAR